MTPSEFVIMKHEAKKAGLHYDLRFKMPNSNMWDSYAVRKGVPTEPGTKVLAVKTTLHTRKDALLTGNIEDGYGAGQLTKWDSGKCIIIKYSSSHISIDFKGSKIKGTYHFISTVKAGDKDKKSYFLFKSKVIKESDVAWIDV
jgi:DNA ligase D-like protein (predicted 3'-phosphoesterase)